MQSSSSVIKNRCVDTNGERKISLDYSVRNTRNNNSKEEYDGLLTSIVETAKAKSDVILRNTYERVVGIEQEAENRGYSNGLEAGTKKGYEEGYENAIQSAVDEANAIKDNADMILKSAKMQYESYLENKNDDIKLLIVDIVSNILNKEVKNTEGISEIIYNTLKNSKNNKTFIIKCNEAYIDGLNEKVELWKQSLGFKGDIFFIADESLGEGIALIDKDNGKIEIDINKSIDKIREIIMNS